MSKPKSVKEAISTFERNYSKYDSNPAYKPSEIYKLPEVRSHVNLTAKQAEGFIDSIASLLNDNKTRRELESNNRKMDLGKVVTSKNTRLNVSKDFYDRIESHLGKVTVQTDGHITTVLFDGVLSNQLKRDFVDIAFFIEIGKLPLPDQIHDFYIAASQLVGVLEWCYEMKK